MSASQKVRMLLAALDSSKWKEKEFASNEFTSWLASFHVQPSFPIDSDWESLSRAYSTLLQDEFSSSISNFCSKSKPLTSAVESRCITLASNWRVIMSTIFMQEKLNPGMIGRKLVDRLFQCMREMLWCGLRLLAKREPVFLVSIHGFILRVAEQFLTDCHGIRESFISVEHKEDMISYCLSALSGFSLFSCYGDSDDDVVDEEALELDEIPCFPFNSPFCKLFLPAVKVINFFLTSHQEDPNLCCSVLRIFLSFLAHNRSDVSLSSLMVSTITALMVSLENCQRSAYLAMLPFVIEIALKLLNECRSIHFQLTVEICSLFNCVWHDLDESARQVIEGKVDYERFIENTAAQKKTRHVRAWVFIDFVSNYFGKGSSNVKSYATFEEEYSVIMVSSFLAFILSVHSSNDDSTVEHEMPVKKHKSRICSIKDALLSSQKSGQTNEFVILALSAQCVLGDFRTINSLVRNPFSLRYDGDDTCFPVLLNCFIQFNTSRDLIDFKYLSSGLFKMTGNNGGQRKRIENWLEMVSVTISSPLTTIPVAREIYCEAIQSKYSPLPIFKLKLKNDLLKKLKSNSGIIDQNHFQEAVDLVASSLCSFHLAMQHSLDHLWLKNVILETIQVLFDTRVSSDVASIPSHEILLNRTRLKLQFPFGEPALKSHNQTHCVESFLRNLISQCAEKCNRFILFEIVYSVFGSVSKTMSLLQNYPTISGSFSEAPIMHANAFHPKYPDCQEVQNLVVRYEEDQMGLDENSSHRKGGSLSSFYNYIDITQNLCERADKDPNVHLLEAAVCMYCVGRAYLGWAINEKLQSLIMKIPGLFFLISRGIVHVSKDCHADLNDIWEEWLMLSENWLMSSMAANSQAFQDHLAQGLLAIKTAGKPLEHVGLERIFSWFMQKLSKGKLSGNVKNLVISMAVACGSCDEEMAKKIWSDPCWKTSSAFTPFHESFMCQINGKEFDSFQSFLKKCRFMYNAARNVKSLPVSNYVRILKYIMFNVSGLKASSDKSFMAVGQKLIKIICHDFMSYTLWKSFCNDLAGLIVDFGSLSFPHELFCGELLMNSKLTLYLVFSRLLKGDFDILQKKQIGSADFKDQSEFQAVLAVILKWRDCFPKKYDQKLTQSLRDQLLTPESESKEEMLYQLFDCYIFLDYKLNGRVQFHAESLLKIVEAICGEGLSISTFTFHRITSRLVSKCIASGYFRHDYFSLIAFAIQNWTDIKSSYHNFRYVLVFLARLHFTLSDNQALQSKCQTIIIKLIDFFELESIFEVCLGCLIRMAISKSVSESDRDCVTENPKIFLHCLLFIPTDILMACLSPDMLSIIKACVRDMGWMERGILKRLFKRLEGFTVFLDAGLDESMIELMAMLCPSKWRVLDYNLNASESVVAGMAEAAYKLLFEDDPDVAEDTLMVLDEQGSQDRRKSLSKISVDSELYIIDLGLFRSPEVRKKRPLVSCQALETVAFGSVYDGWITTFVSFFAARIKSPFASLCRSSSTFARTFLLIYSSTLFEFDDQGVFGGALVEALSKAVSLKKIDFLDAIVSLVMQYLSVRRTGEAIKTVSFIPFKLFYDACMMLNAVPEALFWVEMHITISPAIRQYDRTVPTVSPINCDGLELCMEKLCFGELTKNLKDLNADMFYSLQANLNLDQISARLEHEQNWTQSLTWLLCGGGNRDESKICGTLMRLGYDDLSKGLEVGMAGKGDFSVAWRLGKWDIDEMNCEPNGASCQYVKYKMLQQVCNENESNSYPNMIRGLLTKRDLSLDFQLLDGVVQQVKAWALDKKHQPIPKIADVEFANILCERVQSINSSARILDQRLSAIKFAMNCGNFSMSLGLLQNLRKTCAKLVDKEGSDAAISSSISSCYQKFMEYEYGHFMSKILLKSDSLDSAVIFLREFITKSPFERQVSPLLLVDLGKLEHQCKRVCPTDILRNVFEKAMSRLDNEDSMIDSDSLAKAYFIMAGFAFEEYQSHRRSEHYNQLRRLYDQKTMQIKAFKTSDVTQGVDAKKLKLLEKVLEHDREELRHYLEDLERFRLFAFEKYLRCMQFQSGQKYMNALYRFCALLFEDSKRSNLSEMAGKYSSIPSHNFIPLMYQFISKLTASPSNANDSKSFVAFISSLLHRIISEHPFHTIYPLLAACDGNQLLQKLRATLANSNARVKEILTQAMMLRDVYMEFAKFPLENPPCHKPIKLSSSLRISRIKNMNAIPVITVHASIDKSCKYEDVTYIAGFSPTFKVLGGINLPKVIDCLGSDGLTYRQLVKGKDELRQDAIMEQFFSVVNTLLATKKETRNRSLKIRTYKIIPLADLSGVIEFVSGSTTFGDFLREAHCRYYPSDYETSKCRKIMMAEHEANAGVRSKVGTFRKILERTRPVLRNWFLETFTDARDWVAKRIAFSQSLAANSMLGYAVGLGDRHLQNILLDVTTAEVIHIDLNLIFDQAKRLRIPEQVPFRLTRDFIDAMGVCGVEGVFRNSCEATLAVLCNYREIFLTILEVFRHDPLCRWSVSKLTIENMRRKGIDFAGAGSDVSGKQQSDLGAIESGFSEADRVILKVKEKLSGGVGGASTLSIRGQVNHLIQMASREEHLACIFPGWEPWY